MNKYIADVLSISFDISKDDAPVAIVFRDYSDGINILNEFKGIEAVALHNYLINKKEDSEWTNTHAHAAVGELTEPV